MSMRVRKLARELRGTAGDVLGVLRALGYDRYRSPEDMLPDRAVDKVRSAWKRGIKPLPVDVPEPARPRRPEPRPPDDDLMSRLVPGVVPVDREPERPTAPRARPAAPPEPARPEPEPDTTPTPSSAEFEAIAAERDDATRRAEEAEQRALSAERALEDARRALLEEQARRNWDDAALPEAGDDSLVGVLAARGLRGLDEFERAVEALASTRQLRGVLPGLRIDDPRPLARLLASRLVLVGGAPPKDAPDGVAWLTVAPERAELPDVQELERELARLGERLLLYGCRRVVLVGGRPLWHRLLRGRIDPRIEFRFLPPVPRGAAEAASDVDRSDLVVLWGVDADAAAREVYGSARAQLVEVRGERLIDLVQGVHAALSD